MWMMGYNDGGEDHSFHGRKLRPLIPRPVTSPPHHTTPPPPPCLSRIHHGTDHFLSQYHNLGKFLIFFLVLIFHLLVLIHIYVPVAARELVIVIDSEYLFKTKKNIYIYSCGLVTCYICYIIYVISCDSINGRAGKEGVQ